MKTRGPQANRAIVDPIRFVDRLAESIRCGPVVAMAHEATQSTNAASGARKPMTTANPAANSTVGTHQAQAHCMNAKPP